MAASSSTAAASNLNYDVFLSHRGVDVKKTFASHLYRRLSTFGLKVFLDQPELQRGHYFAPQIVHAIQSASVHVTILSPGYADSEWCLNELIMMLDSKDPIIPVFYHVKPSELRWTLGRYGKALDNLAKKTTYDPETHERKPRYEPSTIEDWRNALSRVAGIGGFELDAFNGNEGLLLEEVVELVLSKVKKQPLEVAKYPIGLDDKVNDLENTVLLQLQQSGKPQILGIVGLGGVGKTTLAKEIFNRKNPDYSKSCFLDDVRDNAHKGTLNSLQCKLLQSLTGSHHTINSVAEGIGMLRMHLSCSKTLVVLDDVDHVDQVDALLPIRTVHHSHSLILITSRNKDVLISSRVEESSIYNLAGLETEHSRELFCSHAFNRPYPLPGFHYLVHEFVEACCGFPLSLKVTGALLYGKEKSDWEDQLRSLQRTLPHDIRLSLKRSYDSLNREEQDIFLDIACFLQGQNKDKAIRIWNASGWEGRIGFQKLRNMCLAEVDSKNDIQMHDHLRDMGRDLAENPGLPCRLWRWTENTIDDLLQQPAKIVRGIRMVLGEYNDSLDGIHMRRLQLLDTEDVLVDRILTRVQSPNLIWLRWNNCPYPSLPSSISMNNLRVLEVQGMELRTLWENDSQVPFQLWELKIEGPLSFIPKSIGILKNLKSLVLGGCSEMKSLPDSFGNLTNLQHIQLSQCSALERLPESFGNLINLQHMQLSQCYALVSLPESFGNLANLQHIQLYECSALKSLPETLGNLTNLHHVQLSKCNALLCLPQSFCRLFNLHYLHLEDCINLALSSQTLGDITSLQCINLSGCLKIKFLPEGVAQQRSLKQLRLGGTNLIEIGMLRRLQLPRSQRRLLKTPPLEVLVVGSPLLETLPSPLRDVGNLKELQFCACHSLRCLPQSLGLLTQLVELILEDCPLINELPFLLKKKNELRFKKGASILPRLKRLQVSDTGISEISFGEGVCVNLRALTITRCNNLEEVGTLPNTLIDLSFSNCHNLRELDNIYGLKKLQMLDISGCTELGELLRVETLVSLSILDASRCVKLKGIWGLGQLTKFQHLLVGGCSELQELRGIRDCVSLWRLDVKECPKLQWSEGVVELLRQRNGFCLEGV